MLTTLHFQLNAFVMDKVVKLAYMGHKKQRSPALAFMKKAVDEGTLLQVKTSSPELWLRYKTNVRDMYSLRMSTLVTAANPDWQLQWYISVKLMGRDLHKGAWVINSLLKVEETAFKSGDALVRR